MKYEIGFHSLQGARSSNQDRVAYAERDNAVFMVLADGLGGHAGGSIAAEIATKWSIQTFKSLKQPVITQPSAFLALTMIQAHDQIVSYSKVKFPKMHPRTTCVYCLVQDGYAYWAHVGDSRLYHFRGDKLLERTHDHSTVEQMFLRGLITEEDMRSHPQKNHITRCLGGNHRPEVELGNEVRLEKDDRLLLCSDGVWEAFDIDTIISFMKRQPLDEGVEEMLHTAEDKMKQVCDNITAIGLNWYDKAATNLPLQNLGSAAIDQKNLLDPVKSPSTKKKPANKPADTTAKPTPIKQTSPSNKREEVKQEIEELENFLANQQKKPL
ncbi:MAG: protein phosphatase 2C domain-containing protein [Gammaproteobacteria bacterium]|nr:protein phosphatase 2C domain-containing protein [Gammaproteobacteria bacterium]